MEARAHPAVTISMVAAALAVTAAALVAIAYMLGWIPSRASLPTPVGIANPAQQATGVASDLALLPGESLVTTQEPAKAAEPEPATPSYAKAAPAAPKRAVRQRAHCVSCGSIAAITARGRGEWEVRVRFEDGSDETLRYREPPPFHLGERVRLEQGRLERE
jgi:hypothetical protein